MVAEQGAPKTQASQNFRGIPSCDHNKRFHLANCIRGREVKWIMFSRGEDVVGQALLARRPRGVRTIGDVSLWLLGFDLSSREIIPRVRYNSLTAIAANP